MWNYQQGVAHLGLSFNVHTLRVIPVNRQQVGLKVKIKAEGRKVSGEWQNRLIRDHYFTSDEPFASDNQLWESSWRHEIEYGLAGVQILPDEELRITLDIKQPNGSLNDGHPRLRLVGNHDYAALGPLRMLNEFLMHGGFWISLLLLTGLVYLAWSPKQLSVK